MSLSLEADAELYVLSVTFSTMATCTAGSD